MDKHRADKTINRRQFLSRSALAAAATLVGCRPAARAAVAKAGLRVAFVGLGGRAQALVQECLQYNGNIVALCDVDRHQLATPVKTIGKAGGTPQLFSDYRRLLDDDASFDAVVIAAPDHWHAPLCRAFMQAGKHVYCEKPLTRTVGEARALRELAGRSRVVTQLGNQGSAAATLRRSVEVIRVAGRSDGRRRRARSGAVHPARLPHPVARPRPRLKRREASPQRSRRPERGSRRRSGRRTPNGSSTRSNVSLPCGRRGRGSRMCCASARVAPPGAFQRPASRFSFCAAGARGRDRTAPDQSTLTFWLAPR